MVIKMNNEQKKILIKNMAANLPMLRTRLDLTQEEIANIIGVSRHTIIAIENKKRDMTWNTFLSLILIFTRNENTNKLLSILEIYTDEFDKSIKVG